MTSPAVATKPDDRLSELDALRGIAALAVLAHHAVQLVPRIEHPAIPGIGWLRYTLMHLTPLRVIEFGRPAVLFFFVLSGYVLMRALLRTGSPGVTAFAVQRTVRLGLPVLASVMLSVLLWLLFADPNLPDIWRNHSLYTWLEPPSLQQVATNVLLVADNDDMRLNVVLWSLVHEWRLTLFLPLLLFFRGRTMLFIALIVAAMALGIMGGATENQVLLGPHFHSTIAASLYFAMGIGAGVALALFLGPDVPLLGRDQRLAAAVACIALFCMSSDLAIYAGSVLLILLARQPGRFRQALRSAPAIWAGRLSFSLYLVHVPVLVASLHLLHATLPPLAIAAIGSIAALLAAAAFHPLVEEPSRRLARWMERRLARPGWRQPTSERHRPVVTRSGEWAAEGGMAAPPS